jgi:phage shock protein A
VSSIKDALRVIALEKHVEELRTEVDRLAEKVAALDSLDRKLDAYLEGQEASRVMARAGSAAQPPRQADGRKGF